jgi:hypothetical protein
MQAKRLLKAVNSTPLTKAEIGARLGPQTEGPELNPPRFEDPDRALSLVYRSKALARLLEQGVPGWDRPVKPGGQIHPAILDAAGRAPIAYDDGQVGFKRAEFLELANRLALAS